MILCMLMYLLYMVLDMSYGVSFYLFWVCTGVIGTIITMLSDFNKDTYKEMLSWESLGFLILSILLGLVTLHFSIEELDRKVRV